MTHSELKEIETRTRLCAEATLTGEQLRRLVGFALLYYDRLAPAPSLIEPTRAAELPEEPRSVSLARKIISNGHPGALTKDEREWIDYIGRLRSLYERQQERIRGLEKDAETYPVRVSDALATYLDNLLSGLIKGSDTDYPLMAERRRDLVDRIRASRSEAASRQEEGK